MLKVACPWCGERTRYDKEAEVFLCVCGTEIKLPKGAALTDPYAEWRSVYESEKTRRRQGAASGSRGRKRQPPVKKKALFCSEYGEV